MFFPILSVTKFYGDAGAEWVTHWLPLTLLAVITAVIIYNMLLLIARAFGLKDLEREAKSEMLQAVATAFIAISLIALVSGAMTLAQGLIYGEMACTDGPKDITNLDDALDAIRECRIQERAEQIDEIQDKLTTGSETWALFNFLNMDFSVFGITFLKGSWIPSIYEDVEERRIINNLATVMLISLNAQSFLLLYIKANMLEVFLPMGILLRSFKFTRGVGALFMGLGIGFYFIFPVIFVLLDPGFVKTDIPESPPIPAQQFCYPTMGFATTIFNTVQESGAATGLSALSIGNLRSALASTYVSLIIHPLLSLFITLVFVRYIITVLGGDTTALVRMVTKVI